MLQEEKLFVIGKIEKEAFNSYAQKILLKITASPLTHQ
jgi:hypothetical protein